MKKKSAKGISIGRIAENRRAKFDYSIIETIEAGIILLGVKSRALGLEEQVLQNLMLQKSSVT